MVNKENNQIKSNIIKFKKLTQLIQLQNLIFKTKTVKEILDLGAEGAGGLGEDHHLVVLDSLLNHLHGGARHWRHLGDLTTTNAGVEGAMCYEF